MPHQHNSLMLYSNTRWSKSPYFWILQSRNQWTKSPKKIIEFALFNSTNFFFNTFIRWNKYGFHHFICNPFSNLWDYMYSLNRVIVSKSVLSRVLLARWYLGWERQRVFHHILLDQIKNISIDIQGNFFTLLHVSLTHHLQQSHLTHLRTHGFELWSFGFELCFFDLLSLVCHSNLASLSL